NDFSIDENSRANTGSDCEKDRVLHILRRALPRLAKNITSAVAFDFDGNIWNRQRSANRILQRIRFPPGNIRRPNGSAFPITDSRNGNANGTNFKPAGARNIERLFDLLLYQFAYLPTRSRFKLSNFPV